MRWIQKGQEPPTVAEIRCVTTTNVSTSRSARSAFDQLDKRKVRERLAAEQGWLCAFCMRRVDHEVPERGVPEPTMKIAHRRRSMWTQAWRCHGVISWARATAGNVRGDFTGPATRLREPRH